MFLIATADERFWKTDEPVLFLGEWCKLYSRRTRWQDLKHEVLEYHWDDRKKLFADYQYLQGLYERVLVDLVRSLNKIHQKDHPVRYWRIIIGPWLFYFIQVFYDRYACIEQAAQRHPVTGALAGRYHNNEWVPKDYAEFSDWVYGDAFNQFLYSWIIERKKAFPFQYVEGDPPVFLAGSKKRKPWAKRLIKRSILIYERCLPHRLNTFVLISSYLRPQDQWSLQLSLGQWPSIYPPEVAAQTGRKFDEGMRQLLLLKGGSGQFEEFLFQIIPQQVPQAYMEDFAALQEQAMARYPPSPQVIVTANDFYFNEGFKVYSAEKSQEGAKLAGIQHGGAYGTTLFYADEEHEKKISDVYYSWGWGTEEKSNVTPLAAAKFNPFKKGITPDPKGKILLTLGLVPRYSYHLYSIFVASSGVSSYFQDQFSFIKSLDENARRQLLIRAYPIDWGWSQKERFEELFPGSVFDHRKSVIESMKASRLYVGTYNSTTYLESFMANMPTILYWNPEHWEIRETARPYFDRIKAAGILHDTPEAAAAKVNEVFGDPMAWWHQPDVQSAKNDFCSRFALTTDKWLIEWRRELLNLAMDQQKIIRKKAHD